MPSLQGLSEDTVRLFKGRKTAFCKRGVLNLGMSGPETSHIREAIVDGEGGSLCPVAAQLES